MRLKKKAKVTIAVSVILIVLVLGGLFVYNVFFDKKVAREAKILKEIDEYGYELKDTRNDKYHELFAELEEILSKEEVDEKAYVSKISEMVIYDFYTLDDKIAKTDVGAVDFLYSEVVDNFLMNAEDTYYKYLESDIYSDREQILPIVESVTIGDIENISYDYLDKTDENAYKVPVTWTYGAADYASYQSSATLIFIHNENRLDLVELSNE